MWFSGKLSPSILTKLLLVYVVVGVIWKFLTETAWGILVVSVFMYFLIPHITSIVPLTPMQLIVWTSDLPAEYKISVFSSLLTVVGFIIAFHTATINWKQQMSAQLKAAVAGDIEEFFNEVSRLTRNTKLYAELLIEAVDQIQQDGVDNETVFAIKYILSKTPEFIASRERLSFLSVEVYRILGKNSVALSSIWGGYK